MTKRTRTILDLNDKHARVTLPEPFWTAKPKGPQDSTGTWITALYHGPRTGRCFVQTYSIWDDGTGRIQGYRTREVTPSELARFAARVDAGLPESFDNRNAVEA
jgi:hypothetical protein